MLLSVFSDMFENARNIFSNFNFFTDFLDILLVTFLIYSLIMQLRKTQSIQIIKGLLLIAVVYTVVVLLNMQASSYIFNHIFSDVFIILVIVFSPEIRQSLEHVGRSKFKKFIFFNSSNEETHIIESINAVTRACGSMSKDKIGSLIIFQRKSFLGDITNDSVKVDAITTSEMLQSIFFPNSTMHDGAIVIKEGRIVAARCIVPLKNDREISGDMGTRHRAALEVSIRSDAVAVVTSEETGIISIAVDGQLIRGITDSELREKLGYLLLREEDNDQNSQGRFGWFRRLVNLGGNKNGQ